MKGADGGYSHMVEVSCLIEYFLGDNIKLANIFLFYIFLSLYSFLVVYTTWYHYMFNYALTQIHVGDSGFIIFLR